MLDYIRQIANVAPYLFPKTLHSGSGTFPLSSLQPSSSMDERSQSNLPGAADLANLSKTDYLSRNERVSIFFFA